MSQSNNSLRYRSENAFSVHKERRLLMDEINLGADFSKGDEKALSHVINTYGQRLLRYCHNILCDYSEAQDAVQITFIKAYEKRESFKPGTSLSSWLYKIAYNTCIDIIRKKRLLFFLPDIHQSTSSDNFICDDLKKALLSLKPDERALVFSRIIDEKSFNELQNIYQCSAATLRKRYERAKKKLAKSLKESNSYYLRLEEGK